MSPLSDKFLIINTLHFIPFSLIKNACLQNLSESYGNLKCQVNWKHWHGTFVNYVSLMTNLCQTCMGFASVRIGERITKCRICSVYSVLCEINLDLLNIFLKKPLGINGQTISVMHK